MTTKDDCIEALRRAARDLDASPTKAQYERLGYMPASATIIRAFGTWNAAKDAAELETYPSRGPRVEEMPDDASFSDEEWCELTVDQRWHYRNVKHNGRRTLHRRNELRTWVYTVKRDSDGCVRCGETNPACLDFHHRDPEQKLHSIAKMVTNGYSRENIRAEIEKCDLLCANCHRLEHHSLPPSLTNQ